MSDPGTSPDGFSHTPRTESHAYAPGSYLDRLRDQTAAILDGTDVDDSDDAHAAGIHLGAVLRASGVKFHVVWDTAAPGLAGLHIARTGIEHVTAAGVDADQIDDGTDMVSYLLTGPECRAIAAAVEASWASDN